MIDELAHRGKQKWELLDAVVSGRLSLPMLYAAHSLNRLDDLRDRINDVDLSPLVDEWLAAIGGRVCKDTVEHYRVHVRSLIAEHQSFPRSELTFERLAAWLSSVKRSKATQRKYHAAMTGFCRYLRSRGILTHNPMRDVKAPAASAPRLRYLDHPDVKRIIAALEEPYRTIVALMHGTGIEVSAALAVKRRDLDLNRREIRARGTKTKSRDRVVIVEPWVLPYLKRHVRRLMPNAPLFPSLNRWTVSDKHREACKLLEIEDYQLRDSRHTFAVRAVRAGAPFEVVAQQLGHADTTMAIRVYGRFRPTAEELRRWQRIAEAQDVKRGTR
jgi:integrase